MNSTPTHQQLLDSEEVSLEIPDHLNPSIPTCKGGPQISDLQRELLAAVRTWVAPLPADWFVKKAPLTTPTMIRATHAASKVHRAGSAPLFLHLRATAARKADQLGFFVGAPICGATKLDIFEWAEVRMDETDHQHLCRDCYPAGIQIKKAAL